MHQNYCILCHIQTVNLSERSSFKLPDLEVKHLICLQENEMKASMIVFTFLDFFIELRKCIILVRIGSIKFEVRWKGQQTSQVISLFSTIVSTFS